MKQVALKGFTIGGGGPLTLISGPCVIESFEHTLEMARILKEIARECGVNLIFKASYDKANRSSIHSFRGPGIAEGLKILQEVKDKLGLPVTSDIHTPEEAPIAAKVLDILQIPAFLCRQLDLLTAAARTGKPVNVKQGQFMAPWDMKNVVANLSENGCEQIILTYRGTTFGYNNLVADMRAIPVLRALGVPTCFDASHSVQLPGGKGDRSGGDRKYIPCLAAGAVAAGADLLFIESHTNPSAAKSDADTVFPLSELKELLQTLTAIRVAITNKKN